MALLYLLMIQPRFIKYWFSHLLYFFWFLNRGEKVAIKKVGNMFANIEDAKRIVREIKLLKYFGGRCGVIELTDLAVYNVILSGLVIIFR